MKKRLFMVAAVALVMAACNKEEINTPAKEQTQLSSVQFTAYTDATKTALNDDMTVSWEQNDAISINGAKFETKEAGSPAIFDHTDGTFDESATIFEAIYPYSAGASFSSVVIPTEQTITVDGFPMEGVVSVASSETTNLSFKNVTSLLKFQVPTFDETITSVTITSDEYLAGEVSINYNGGEPTWTAQNATKTITIKGEFNAGEDYYVSVLPSDNHTFTVRINGYLSKASTKDSKVLRSKIMDMKTLPEPVATTYYLKGLNGDWETGKVFYKDVADCYLLQDANFSGSSFKFNQGDSWGRPISIAIGRWVYTYGGDNMSGIEGTYDIYVKPSEDVICFVEVDKSMPEYNSSNKLLHILTILR